MCSFSKTLRPELCSLSLPQILTFLKPGLPIPEIIWVSPKISRKKLSPTKSPQKKKLMKIHYRNRDSRNKYSSIYCKKKKSKKNFLTEVKSIFETESQKNMASQHAHDFRVAFRKLWAN